MAILALIGPTAVGKTAISLPVAEHLNAEIISADSRQVYKHLDIGTAKPSAEELRRVPHHFVNELELETPYSAGLFAKRANARIHRILNSGRTPLIVGGSTLYLQALLHGLSPVPAADASLRRKLEQRLEKEGSNALYEEFKAIDEASAASIDPTKTQRIVRALEVYYQTGRPISSFHHEVTLSQFKYNIKILTMNREHLYERINFRVDQMLNAGLIDEVKKLKSKGYTTALPALKTIGYQEVFAFLGGAITREEMIRLIKRNTRHYAKRQLTWFRRYAPHHWVDLDGVDRTVPESWEGLLKTFSPNQRKGTLKPPE